jgi:hypothetical protein
MRHSSHLVLTLTLANLALLACGGSQTPSAAPPEGEPVAPWSAAGSSNAGDSAPRPTISAEACEANHGIVVGDIGDGAIHRPEYRCSNGAKPTANIGAAEGGPISIEGSVCCPK